MFESLQPAREISASHLADLPRKAFSATQPTVLRGAFSKWPLVRAALHSDEAAIAYLEQFYTGRPVSTIVAPAAEQGRFFYQPDSKLMNFERASGLLPEILKGLLDQKKSAHPLGIALQAIPAADTLPGLERDNPNPLVPEGSPARLWIGNKSTVAPHFDVSGNLACVAAGRRRFVMFPPEQTANLYPGPMDVTPANVPISMVSMTEPELDRFPRYSEALGAAVVAELEPGDAIYIPYLWWHGVQSLSGFNILANYWWNDDEISGRYPYASLLNLLYVLYRDMPSEHRCAWRALFDHYVFQTRGNPAEALPPSQRDENPRIESAQVARLKEAIRELLG